MREITALVKVIADLQEMNSLNEFRLNNLHKKVARLREQLDVANSKIIALGGKIDDTVTDDEMDYEEMPF